MKAAMRQVEEIDRLKKAIEKTSSAYLKRDYSKNIRKLKEELREYCAFRGLDYESIIGNR